MWISVSSSHLADSHSLLQGRVDEAIIMYQDLHRWDDALQVAEKKSHPQLEALRQQYLEYLHQTGQGEGPITVPCAYCSAASTHLLP